MQLFQKNQPIIPPKNLHMSLHIMQGVTLFCILHICCVYNEWCLHLVLIIASAVVCELICLQCNGTCFAPCIATQRVGKALLIVGVIHELTSRSFRFSVWVLMLLLLFSQRPEESYGRMECHYFSV